MIRFNTPAYLNNLAQQPQRKMGYESPLASGNWKEWQSAFREQLKEQIGMNQISAIDLPLNARIVEVKDMEFYRIEKGYITSEPGVEIPFYLMVPNTGNAPYPLVIATHGHGDRWKEIIVGEFDSEVEQEKCLSEDMAVGLQAVQAGYAVLAPDVRGFGEMGRTEEIDNGKNKSCIEMHRIATMYGRTLIGERVHDMGRLIDYAETRPEIDTGRIVITGNSGGGMVAMFTAAIDERISLAVPASYFCKFDHSIVPISHCPCNLIPGIMQLGEMYDIAGLIAPRPVLMVHGDVDHIFPIQGTLDAFEHLQKIYSAMGHPERCELYVGHGGHRYYKERVWSFVKEQLA